MIVLDASILIAYLDADDAHHFVAEAILSDVGDDEVGANSLTIAEVLVAPTRVGGLDLARTILRELDIREVAFPTDTAVRLAEVSAETGLKMPDCCVLLAACGVEPTIATFDQRLAGCAEDRGITVVRR